MQAAHTGSSTDFGATADHREFGALIAEHLPRLRARAMQLSRGRFDADDLVQDTLLRAFRGRAQLRDRDRMQSWLLSIITNVFIDTVRRRRVRPPQISLDLAPQAAPAAGSDDDAENAPPWRSLSPDALRTAIDQLPDGMRHTFRLFAVEGRDYVAIAASQGIPMGTVASRLQRARKTLRALLAATLDLDDNPPLRLGVFR